jgi:hypothetical protein
VLLVFGIVLWLDWPCGGRFSLLLVLVAIRSRRFSSEDSPETAGTAVRQQVIEAGCVPPENLPVRNRMRRRNSRIDGRKPSMP